MLLRSFGSRAGTGEPAEMFPYYPPTRRIVLIVLMPGYIATQDQSKNTAQQKYSGDRSNRTMNRAENQASAKVDAYKVGNS